MVSNFQWKLMIAGTVGGACALFSSILVFAILACRHKRKLKRQAAERLKRQRLSAQWSTPSAEPSDLLVRDHVIVGRADLPELPHHLDGNYIRPTWGVRPFWMDQGQHSLNHDSGYADLESNRTDSALFLQRSFSPLPRTTNGQVHKPTDVFPAMNNFDIDSGWSRSFDLLSPVRPSYPCFDVTRNPAAKSSNQHVTLPPNPPSGEDAWKSRISCRNSDHQIPRSSFQEPPQRPDCGLQLMEMPHVAVGNQSRSQFAGCRASVVPSSSSEDSEPIWIRRTNANQDSTLTQSMMDCNRMGGSPSSWGATRGNQLMVPNRPARDFNAPHQAAVLENVVRHQKFSVSGYKDAPSKKQNGYSNPWETNGVIEHVVCNGRTNSNRLSSR